MKKIADLNVPETWAEIPWKRYAKFATFKTETELDLTSYSAQIEVVAILTDSTAEIVRMLSKENWGRIALVVNGLLERPINSIPRNSFTHEGRLFEYKINSIAQFVRLEEIVNKKPLDLTSSMLATFFIERKPDPETQKEWYKKLYKAIRKEESNPDLEGWKERWEIIKNLDCETVQQLSFFLQNLSVSSKNGTPDTTKFLLGLLTVKVATAKAALLSQWKQQPFRIFSTDYLRYGICRLTISLIEARLRYSIFLNGNLNRKSK